jgi:hypothetical protein
MPNDIWEGFDKSPSISRRRRSETSNKIVFEAKVRTVVSVSSVNVLQNNIAKSLIIIIIIILLEVHVSSVATLY